MIGIQIRDDKLKEELAKLNSEAMKELALVFEYAERYTSVRRDKIADPQTKESWQKWGTRFQELQAFLIREVDQRRYLA